MRKTTKEKIKFFYQIQAVGLNRTVVYALESEKNCRKKSLPICREKSKRKFHWKYQA
jgi:hypothetical protein